MDRFFGLDTPAGLEDLAHLTTFHDPVSLSIAEELLTDGGVPFLRKDRGAGGVVQLVVGFQTFGSDIFVLPSDLERANELLIPLLSAETIVVDEDEETSEDAE